MNIIISNDFHGTETTVRASGKSRASVRRIRAKLCGSDTCTCGNFMGARGDQRGHMFLERQDGGAEYVGQQK